MRSGAAIEAAERPARLTHQNVERRQVPQFHLGLHCDVDGALGNQAVGPEVAVATHPPHRVGQGHEARP
jgi:hypothetical protein